MVPVTEVTATKEILISSAVASVVVRVVTGGVMVAVVVEERGASRMVV